MKELKTTKKSKWKKIVIILLIIVLVIGGLIFSGMRKAKQAITSVMNAAETGEVTRRSLVDSVGATGTIVSLEKKNITVNLSGVKVSEIDVEVGDSVSEGDQLAVFDTSDIEESLADAKNSLAQTQQKYALSNDSTAQSVSDAERNQEYQIQQAQDALDDAQEKLDDDTDRIAELRDAIANYQAYGIDDLTLSQFKSELKTLEEKTIDADKESLESAQRAYDNTVASQESSVNSALNQQSSTALSQDTTTQRRQIEDYEEQIADGTLYAPFDGIITAVNYDPGDYYTAGSTVLTIQDCSSYEITTEIDEYSISDIEAGQKVLIKTNATGDEEMTGKVTTISPVATTSASAGASTSSSNPTYTVRISIDNPSDRLRLDMSASLSIIIAEHEDALTVPYNAVQTDEDGNTYVLKSTGSASGDAGAMNFEKVPVTVIMESSYYTEISSDELKEGDTVQIIDTTDYTDLMSMMTDQAGGF